MPETTPASSTTGHLFPGDLVMKGGITSGVAYPPVILALKDHYRFRRIGGTSAGAIAAVASAAAEFNREGAGFDILEKVKDTLQTQGFLRSLFQPSPDMRPLMTIIDALFPAPDVVTLAPAGEDKAANQQINRPSQWQLVGGLLWAWLSLPSPLSRWARVGMVIGLLFGAGIAFAFLGAFSLILAASLRTILFSGSLLSLLPIAFLLLCAIIGSLFGGQIGAIIDAIMKISNDTNLYGICSGQTQQGQAQPALTDWMHSQIQAMAGLEESKPLTFGQLSNKPDPQTKQKAGASITLKMITTNLSQSQPYLMPAGLQGFLFKKQDMEKLFPSYVVTHLMTCCQQTYVIKRTDAQGNEVSTTTFTVPEKTAQAEYYFLPMQDDLPIVFAMRMSLSFPILLSAVPLYTIQASALSNGTREVQLQASDLQRNWFSDGGICHNFPLEFFDAWLPHHPTFGINLTALPRQAFEVQRDAQGVSAGSPTYSPTVVNKEHISLLTQSRIVQTAPYSLGDSTLPSLVPPPSGLTASGAIPAVYLPNATDAPDPTWDGLEQTWQFLNAILNTGLGYRETALANLPSYRERIVQIRLDSDEGGMNLNMPDDTIKRVIDKGKEAGELLANFNFNHHQWVRFLVMINQLEYNLALLRDQPSGSTNDPGNASISHKFLQLIEDQVKAFENDPYPYPHNKEWCDRATEFAIGLENLIRSWEQLAQDWESAQNLASYEEAGRKIPLFFQHGAPLPYPVLRVSPEV